MHLLADQAPDRWRVLLLCCAVLCGQYFCYDTPSVVHDHLASYFAISSSDFSWFFNTLYSAYSFPNLVLPLIFGYTVDRFSSSRVLVALGAVACIGQVCFAAGIAGKIPWLAIVGRLIFGVGAESMGVAQSAVLSRYFGGKEIAFALALNVSFARLGTILNDWISPALSSNVGIPATFSVGVLCCFLSCWGAVELSVQIRASPTPSSEPRISDGSLTLLKAAQSLDGLFWLVVTACVGGYCCIMPFISVFTAVRPVNLSQAGAGQMVSIVFLVSAVITPLIGKFVDRFGRATWVLTASCFLLSLTHVLFNNYNHVVVMLTLGMAYAGFVASVWPLVPLTVPEDRVGLAYGILTAFQNAGLTAMPLLIAWIHSATGTYYASRWLFLSLSVVTLVTSACLATEISVLKGDADGKECIDPEQETLQASFSGLFGKGRDSGIRVDEKLE